MQCHNASIIWVLLAMPLCLHNSGIIYVENWNISFDLKVGVRYRADRKYEERLGMF